MCHRELDDDTTRLKGEPHTPVLRKADNNVKHAQYMRTNGCANAKETQNQREYE